MKKRISAALLSVILCFAMLVPAFAADPSPSISVSGTAGQTYVTVNASGLTANKTYAMCSIVQGDELMALFNLKTDTNGDAKDVKVTTGALTSGKTLTVSIPDAAGTGNLGTGSGSVAPVTPAPPPTPSTPPPSGGGDTGGGGGGGGGGGSGNSDSSKAPSISKNTGGNVTVSNDGKTVTITPKDGYAIKDVIINGESVGPVRKYVFEKASRNNTVKVIFEKIGADVDTATGIDRFTDLSNHWAADAIAFVVEEGLFNGVSDTQFGPNASMTRSMLVTVLYRHAGQPTVSGGASFADVAPGQWYSQAVAWAASNGVVTGTGAGFAPNGNVTREQLAAILYRYAGTLNADTSASGSLSGYGDGAKVSDWASDAMAWAVGSKIITGKTGNALDPLGNASRAEVATMLMRFVALLDA